EAMGPANGLGLCGLCAHQIDGVYDQDLPEMAVTFFRSSLRRCRARRFMGVGDSADTPQGSVALSMIRALRDNNAVLRRNEFPLQIVKRCREPFDGDEWLARWFSGARNPRRRDDSPFHAELL